MKNKGMIAKVVSNKKFYEGTLTVSVAIKSKLPKYRKLFTKHKKYIVQYDHKKEISIGQEVIIVSCAPVSKKKRFTVKEIINA